MNTGPGPCCIKLATYGNFAINGNSHGILNADCLRCLVAMVVPIGSNFTINGKVYAMGPSCLWTMIDRTGPTESDFVMMLGNTTAVVIIMLGLMTFGVWHKWDSGKVGGRKCWRLSQTRAENWGVRPRHLTLFIKGQYHPNQDIFLMIDAIAVNCVNNKRFIVWWKNSRSWNFNLV